jgi:hypothetical protein
VEHRTKFLDGLLRFGYRNVSALLVLSWVSGCQSIPGAGLAADDRSPHITLLRGVTGSTLTMRPPHLSGRDFSLTLRNKILFGWVSPAGAGGGGALRVHVDADGAEGVGPHGSIGMDIVTDEAATVADGLWDGQRVHMSFALDGVNGTVADVRETRARGPRVGQLGASGSCQYVLDRQTPEGALEGFSICAGMPQRTRLEVPGVATALLSRSELVTVLLTMLSTPPLASAETTRGFDELEAGP